MAILGGGRRPVEWFCNNPGCELVDVIVRPGDLVVKARRRVCPRCLEPLVAKAPRSAPRLPKPLRPRTRPSPTPPPPKESAR